MGARKPYTVATLTSALAHHESTGALRTVSPPEPGRSTWRIDVPGLPGSPVEFTTAQTWALVVGLSRGERQWRPLDGGGV